MKAGSEAKAGEKRAAYNGLGEMIRQTDAKGQVTTQFHDALGRLIERREYPGGTGTTPFVTVWSFDQYADPNSSGTCTQGIGKLCETRSATLARGATIGGALDLVSSASGGNHSVARSTQFDAYGRAERQVTELREPGSAAPALRRWVSATSYDAESRPDKTTYPSGFILANRYT
ncbi:MAG: RHS repeat protein, partial [Burkholderiales bacterium]